LFRAWPRESSGLQLALTPSSAAHSPTRRCGATRRLRAAGVSGDGKERRVDAIVLATGFQVTRFLSAIDVTGRNGCRLGDEWRDGARAYLGISAPGFPNIFMLYGPNTNNGSILQMLEYQVEFVLGRIQRMQSQGIAWMDARREALERSGAA
jgi:cyclohexanone monooxygenase